MRLKQLELSGFKSFAKKTTFVFDAPVTSIVGPNGSGKSNCAEAFRWVLGERSMKSLRGARGEDLIFNGTVAAPKMNRASVTLVFDNADRKFNVDFDEVAIGREVHRDGTNVYLINGSPVRHRDIVELLANVSLGSSDHYIVNQGDADRVLSANLRERRGMVEDALGLRLYQWKIEESEKKLEKTEENIKQVESLRRELGPHLKFLKKQIEKIEQADRLRQELKVLYFEYLKREEKYLEAEKAQINSDKSGPAGELAQVEQKLGLALRSSESEVGESGHARRLNEIDAELRKILGEKDELSRRLGRLEGVLEIKEAAMAEAERDSQKDFAVSEVADFTRSLEVEIGEAEKTEDVGALKSALGRIREAIRNFWERGRSTANTQAKRDEIENVRREKEAAANSLGELAVREEGLRREREEAARQIAAEAAQVREAERELFELRARRSELQGRLSSIVSREEKLRLEEENFKREIEEGAVLVDHEVKRYRELAPSFNDEENRQAQEERRRKLERLKIRLEDMGVESGDVMKEYKDASERDEFLAREINDLEQSAASLRNIIKDLEEKIAIEFKQGVSRINEKFQEFFSLMFGGGTAKLELIKEEKRRASGDGESDFDLGVGLLSEEEEETREGLEVSVSLPRKKIKGLDMLSGGERALTSIALLFAMSQVNPPPFLILDETDAALDEANSRKYGEMVDTLARDSQLILITHNRETMSRAGVIYGITMGADGVSKQLSIKFDEATSYAK